MGAWLATDRRNGPPRFALQIERVLSRKIIDYWGSEANVIGTQISAMHRR